VTANTLVKRVNDSRSSEVHLPSEEAPELHEWSAVGLAMIVGFLDAYGIITYDTYLFFMSGNTTQAGYRMGQANFWKAVPFRTGSRILRSPIIRRSRLAHSPVRRRRRLVLGVVAASLALIIGFTQLGLSSGWVPIAMLSVAEPR
jgi:uncharacterized membrane protein YoaK (UPF0700 family)